MDNEAKNNFVKSLATTSCTLVNTLSMCQSQTGMCLDMSSKLICLASLKCELD